MSFCSRSPFLVTVAFPHFHCFNRSLHSYKSSSRHILPSCKHSWNASCLSLMQIDTFGCIMDKKFFIAQVLDTPVERLHCDSGSRMLACNGAAGPSIRFAVRPFWHTSSIACHTRLQYKKRSTSTRNDTSTVPCRSSLIAFATIGKKPCLMSVSSGQALWRSNAVMTYEKCMIGSNISYLGTWSMRHSFSIGVGSRDGSWNKAWNIKPACWLQARHSAWVLFGLCACLSAAAGTVLPNMLLSDPAQMQAAARPGPAVVDSASDEMLVTASHTKQVYTKYSVTRIPGDGRCLFRAIVHGACLRSGKPAPDQVDQRDLADELRSKVVDELIKRRDETEWFIEGDFDAYVKRMRGAHVWGGEPELLMASHVLKIPITVYIYEESSKGLISIADYGQEYGKYPVKVLYDGTGHYDALEFPGSDIQSKL